MMKRAIGRIGGAALLALLAFSGDPRPALAGGHTHIGIGVVAPIYPYGDPYYRPYRRPPDVYYVPAPAPAAPAAPTVDKSYCREYQSTANIAGKTQKTYGAACRQPDGSWRIIN